ncbi:unnamed protein product [Durusdinium trenchii]
MAGHPQVEGLVVVKLQKSEVVGRWNAQNPEVPLEVGHVILEINGLTDSEKMLEQFAPGRTVDILVNVVMNAQHNRILSHCLRKQRLAAAVETLLHPVDNSSENDDDAVETSGPPVCAICQEDMKVKTCCKKSEVVSLECKHRFHCQCVKQWLVNGQLRCPLCNHQLQLRTDTD